MENSNWTTLDYDFSQEKDFSYNGLSIEESVRHIEKFTSGIWQIHPFGEGNTRSATVFIIKYLKTFGFNVNNETFAENISKYLESITAENVDISETLVAKEYFSYYHKRLNRRIDDPINGRLNYGYAVIRSYIARSLVRKVLIFMLVGIANILDV